MDNDVTQFIISSDIQKGNSGGAIYDKTGKIVDYEHKKYLNKLDLYISLLKNIYDKPIVGHLIYVDLNKVI